MVRPGAAYPAIHSISQGSLFSRSTVPPIFPQRRGTSVQAAGQNPEAQMPSAVGENIEARDCGTREMAGSA
jgi:hypothetical protein